jgi:hypothetical protein
MNDLIKKLEEFIPDGFFVFHFNIVKGYSKMIHFYILHKETNSKVGELSLYIENQPNSNTDVFKIDGSREFYTSGEFEFPNIIPTLIEALYDTFINYSPERLLYLSGVKKYYFSPLNILKYKPDIIDWEMEHLGLNVRPYNILRREGKFFVKDIINTPLSEIYQYKSLGTVGARSIQYKLEDMGLTFKK